MPLKLIGAALAVICAVLAISAEFLTANVADGATASPSDAASFGSLDNPTLGFSIALESKWRHPDAAAKKVAMLEAEQGLKDNVKDGTSVLVSCGAVECGEAIALKVTAGRIDTKGQDLRRINSTAAKSMLYDTFRKASCPASKPDDIDQFHNGDMHVYRIACYAPGFAGDKGLDGDQRQARWLGDSYLWKDRFVQITVQSKSFDETRSARLLDEISRSFQIVN